MILKEDSSAMSVMFWTRQMLSGNTPKLGTFVSRLELCIWAVLPTSIGTLEASENAGSMPCSGLPRCHGTFFNFRLTAVKQKRQLRTTPAQKCGTKERVLPAALGIHVTRGYLKCSGHRTLHVRVIAQGGSSFSRAGISRSGRVPIFKTVSSERPRQDLPNGVLFNIGRIASPLSR